MPNTPKTPAPGGTKPDLSEALRRKPKRPRFDPRALPRGKADAGQGQQRGGRPPRFPGRTGGR